MYRAVIEVDGVEHDSVYSVIKAHKLVASPTYLYANYLTGYNEGDIISLDLDQYTHFRGCSETNKVSITIKFLEAI